jgi:hypothetical protein
MAEVSRAKRGAYFDGAMTFEQIATEMGVSHQRAMALYRSALRKIAGDAHAIDVLRFLLRDAPLMSVLRDLASDPEARAVLADLAQYHYQLRGRSVECRFAREGW